MKHNYLLHSLLLVMMFIGGVSMAYAATTYKLTQVTSVSTGNKYVFEQGGYVMNNSISSNALQTTNSYKTKGLAGTESYVWTLETAKGGFYMKNVSLSSSQYLNNTSSTNVSFGSKSSIWAFNFQEDNTVLIQNTSNSDRFLGFTTSTSHAYKAYATSNLSSYPHAIKVYKLEEETLSPCGLALTGAPVTLSFDLYNNSSAQTVSYTTSSTGAVTVSGGDGYVTTSVSGNTITVTPTAVTPSPQTITVSQAADNTYDEGSVTFTVSITDSTPAPTHTATFSVNGATSTQDFAEGAAITFPSNPADISVKTFVGWVTTAINGTTNDAPSFVTSATMGNSDVTYYAVFADKTAGDLTKVTDVLTRETTGVASTTSYSDWSGKTASSAAVYAGNSAGSNNTIQIRSDNSNSNSGIITTSSGGKVKKITVDWYSETLTGRTLDIYGKNTAYSSAADLYSSTKGTKGDNLGSIAKGTSTELTITGDYEFIGLRSNSGAMYFSSISIEWQNGTTPDTYSNYCTTIISVTLNASGYATFASNHALDFSSATEYSAWQITSANSSTGVITFTQINDAVAAGTGVLLKGTASKTINIPVAASGSDISSTNKLTAITTATAVTADQYYGLSGSQFVKVNAGTVPAGKALLPVSEVSGARALTFVFADETTGISTIESGRLLNDDAMYNLNGQRVVSPKRGLYIVNGKKVLR